MARFDPTKAQPSSYTNFLDCPMKFWIFRLHPRASEFRNKGKSIGSVVDQTLHRYFQRPAENRTLDSLKADFDLVWLQEKDNVREWCILPAEEGECKNDAWQVLSSFYKTFDVKVTPIYIPPLSTNPAKFDLLIKLSLAPDLTIQGWGDRLDKVGENYEVVDYKTKTGAELYEEKNNLQLRMYALLFDEWLKRKNLPGEINKLAFLYLTPRGVEKREFNFTEEDKAATIAQVKDLQKKIKEYWEKYGDKPWPCTCGTCTNLLAKMEARANEWATASNIPQEPPTPPETSDLPF